MFCGKCGNQMPDGSKFCNKCGASQNLPLQNSPTDVNQLQFQDGSPIYRQRVAYQGENDNGKKNTKKIVFIVAGLVIGALVLLVLLIVIGLFSDDSKLSVDKLKSLYLLDYSQTEEIGDVFEDYSYFENAVWSEFETETDDGTNAECVMFNADVSMENGEDDSYITENITLLFYRLEDMDSDEASIDSIYFTDVTNQGEYIGDIILNNYDSDNMLECIYNDEPFTLVPSDYGLSY